MAGMLSEYWSAFADEDRAALELVGVAAAPSAAGANSVVTSSSRLPGVSVCRSNALA